MEVVVVPIFGVEEAFLFVESFKLAPLERFLFNVHLDTLALGQLLSQFWVVSCPDPGFAGAAVEEAEDNPRSWPFFRDLLLYTVHMEDVLAV